MQRVLLMNLTNVYGQQDLAQACGAEVLDLSGLEGTRGYCSEEAADEIRKRIAPYGPGGIHFLDSGNYHYLTLFWLEQIREPFDLIVWDHHTDMQESAFAGLLSCGSWILRAAQTVDYLRRVVIIGPPGASVAELPADVRERAVFLTEEDLRADLADLDVLRGDLPVYLSVDKDVFCPEEIATDWDQGEMTEEAFGRQLDLVLADRRLIGLDVCGEPPADAPAEEICKSNGFNRRLAARAGGAPERS